MERIALLETVTLIFTAVLTIIFYLAIAIPYILTLRNALRQISFENREMRPGQTWLLLIPLFNIIWSFIVVNKISSSIQKEFISRGFPTADRPTHGVGLAMNILTIFCYVPGLKMLAMLPAFICWIIYWVKVAEYKNRLKQLPQKHEDSMIFGTIQH